MYIVFGAIELFSNLNNIEKFTQDANKVIHNELGKSYWLISQFDRLSKNHAEIFEYYTKEHVSEEEYYDYVQPRIDNLRFYIQGQHLFPVHSILDSDEITI